MLKFILKEILHRLFNTKDKQNTNTLLYKKKTRDYKQKSEVKTVYALKETKRKQQIKTKENMI